MKATINVQWKWKWASIAIKLHLIAKRCNGNAFIVCPCFSCSRETSLKKIRVLQHFFPLLSSKWKLLNRSVSTFDFISPKITCEWIIVRLNCVTWSFASIIFLYIRKHSINLRRFINMSCQQPANPNAIIFTY
jgi:hypothetical protein